MKKQQPDYILLFTVSLLIGLGLIMITSAGVVISYERFNETYYFLKHQIFNLLIGIALGFIAFKIPYKLWSRFALFFFTVSLILLIGVFIPGFGLNYGGAKRWISFGFLSIQPAEILKLTLIIYLAAWLSKKNKEKGEDSQFLLSFFLIIGLIAFLLIKQPDVGTLGIIFLTAVAIYFLAGIKILHFIPITVAAISAFWILIKTAPYRINRWTIFLHPEIDPQGIGYQINQTLLALGSGGIFGLGLGQSRQKYNYLPEPITDSIIAIIGEEIGFIGLVFLVSLFLIFALRGFKICKNIPDSFGKLLAGGITFQIVIQALIHMGAISGLIPLTGLPLPFISYGGSSLIISLIGTGILLNISSHVKT